MYCSDVNCVKKAAAITETQKGNIDTMIGNIQLLVCKTRCSGHAFPVNFFCRSYHNEGETFATHLEWVKCMSFSTRLNALMLSIFFKRERERVRERE